MRRASLLLPTVVTTAMAVMRASLEDREILALFPVADFEGEAIDLGLLQCREVVDEEVTQPGAQGLAVAQRRNRLVEGARQQWRLRFVGGVGRRSGVGLVRQAVEAADDLARHIKVGVGGRLADAILEMRRGIARRA